MDRLISKRILTVDDKEKINQFLDQPSRNQKILEILTHRPHCSFNMFVGALRESDQQGYTLLERMSKFIDKDVTIQNVPHIEEIAGNVPLYSSTFYIPISWIWSFNLSHVSERSVFVN